MLESHGFERLPPEIRGMIWQAALPSTRVVFLEARPIEPEEDILGREDVLYYVDRFGKVAEHEDTRSIPEKDMHLRVHTTTYGQDGHLKRQSQLLKYGFMSNKPTPEIAHAPFYDPATYQNYYYQPNPTPVSRDVRLLTHVFSDSFDREPRVEKQAQLHKYGFTSSRPRPTIHHVGREEAPVRFHAYGSFPVALHVCHESRQQALRCGYTLSFSTPWAPAQTWFNFNTDILSVHHPQDMECCREPFAAADRQRVRRLALSRSYGDYARAVFDMVRTLGNLEELLIVMADTRPCPSDDCFALDRTAAEVLARDSPWATSAWDGPHELQVYNTKHPDGPPFYEQVASGLRLDCEMRLRAHARPGDPPFKLPRFRCVNVTDATGKRELEALRRRYWEEREWCPPKQDWERFAREDREARVVARPPSPFDVRYADDLEVDYEIFKEGLMQ